MNTMDEIVIAKIEKLLALAASSNEHEAKLAATKAQELMLAHNLSAETIAKRKDSDYETRSILETRILATQDKFVLDIIAKFYFVTPIHRRKRRVGETEILFVGSKANVKVASYVFDFLSRTFVELWDDYKFTNRATLRARQSYYLGLHHGIIESLEKALTDFQSRTGLIKIKDAKLEAFMSEEHPDIDEGSKRDIKVHDRQALEDGIEHGRDVKIQRGIENTSTQTDVKQLGGARCVI